MQFLLVWIGLFLSGCLSQGGGGERIAQGGEESEREVGGPTFDEDLPPVSWYLDKTISGTVTINANVKTIAYLRGAGAHQFLAAGGNHLEEYCLVASYERTGLKRQLRFRVVPLSLAREDVQERMFRVDISLAEEGKVFCGGKVSSYDASGAVLGEWDSTVNGDQIGYSPEELCDSCSGIESAGHLALYRIASSGGISDQTRIPHSSLDLGSLGLSFDMGNQRLEEGDGGSVLSVVVGRRALIAVWKGSVYWMESCARGRLPATRTSWHRR